MILLSEVSKKSTNGKDLRVVRTNKRRLMDLSKCPVSDKRTSFIKEQEPGELIVGPDSPLKEMTIY